MNRIRPIESNAKPMIRKCIICHREVDVAKGKGVRIRFNKGDLICHILGENF